MVNREKVSRTQVKMKHFWLLGSQNGEDFGASFDGLSVEESGFDHQ
jgi:hypothetical protein